MSWNIQKPGDYINGPLTVVGTISSTGNIQTDAELYTLGGRVSLYRTAGASYLDWSSGQALVWRTVTSVGGAGASELMRLNSTGLGLGTSPSYRLHLSGAPAATSGGLAYFRDTTANGSNNSLCSVFFSSSPGTDFYVGKKSTGSVGSFSIGNGGTGAEYLGINSSGVVFLSGGNAAANGIGIAFPSAQSASTDANTLDDYEEGDFTPLIQGSSSAGTATYAGRYGRYTKVGRLVTVSIYIDWSGHTGTGDTRVAGLPFANSSAFSAASIGYANSIAVTAGNMISGYVDASQPWILLNQIPTGGGPNTTVPIDAAGTLVLSASYVV
jgi:hypothetical protein